MDILTAFSTLLDDPARLAPAIAAISAMAVVVAVAWPKFGDQRRRLRMLQVAGSKRNVAESVAAKRGQSRERLISLRYAAPKRLYTIIVEKLSLGKLLKNPKTQTLIYQAGYRGPAAPIKITAMRVLVAAGAGALTAFYTSILFGASHPLITRLLVVAAITFAGWHAPIIFLRNRLQKRRTEIQRNWPDAMDLMLICVESGMSIEAAFRKVAEEIAVQAPTLGEELSLTTAELAYLQDRQKAYRRLAARTDVEDVRSVAMSLIQAEKYGTPIGQALRVLSKESRALRMQAAEKKAAALPPKLTVPMIIFFLPVLFAVVMTPAIIQILGQ